MSLGFVLCARVHFSFVPAFLGGDGSGVVLLGMFVADERKDDGGRKL